MISLDQRDVLHTLPSPLSRTASGRIDTFLENYLACLQCAEIKKKRAAPKAAVSHIAASGPPAFVIRAFQRSPWCNQV
jgi:hypothetical protein